MNKINPKKLLNSKWTAVNIKNKEKHFIVTEMECNEDGKVISCTIQAVMTKRSAPINWNDLQDQKHWLYGWK